MLSEKKQIVMILYSLIGGTVFFVSYLALVGFFPPPHADLGAQAVSELYAQNNLRIRIGAAICTIASGFIVPWSVVVAVQMARLEEGTPVMAILAALGGALGSVIYMIPSMVWGIAAFSPERDPALTLILHETAMLMLVAPWSFFPLQVLPIAVVALTQKAAPHTAFPRWSGYLCVFTAMATISGNLCLLFKLGPFAWNGLLAFWIPVLDYLVWILALSYTMQKAIRAQAAVKSVR